MDERAVKTLTDDEIAELVELAERLIAYKPGRWWERLAVSTSDRIQMATLALVVAIYRRQVDER